MKILAAIQSSENPRRLAKTTLRWATRAGFNMRLFLPDDSQIQGYVSAIEDANYQYHLNIPRDFIVTGVKPHEYALAHGYDLIVYLRDDMNKWKFRVNHDMNPLVYAKEVGQARLEFSRDKKLLHYPFINGVTMERV